MKKLFLLLILLLLVSYKSISQVVILDSITSLKVVRDLERKDLLESENEILKLQISEYSNSITVSKNIEQSQKYTIEYLKTTIRLENINNQSLESVIQEQKKDIRKLHRKNTVLTVLSASLLIISLTLAVK